MTNEVKYNVYFSRFNAQTLIAGSSSYEIKWAERYQNKQKYINGS